MSSRAPSCALLVGDEPGVDDVREMSFESTPGLSTGLAFGESEKLPGTPPASKSSTRCPAGTAAPTPSRATTSPVQADVIH